MKDKCTVLTDIRTFPAGHHYFTQCLLLHKSACQHCLNNSHTNNAAKCHTLPGFANHKFIHKLSIIHKSISLAKHILAWFNSNCAVNWENNLLVLPFWNTHTLLGHEPKTKKKVKGKNVFCATHSIAVTICREVARQISPQYKVVLSVKCVFSLKQIQEQ